MTTTEEAERQEWLARRRQGIGSSDIAALFNLNPWQTPWHVYLDKIGELPDADTPRKKWGRKLEDVVAFVYEEETGRTTYLPEQKVFEHRSIPYLLATPDRFVYPDGQRAVLELKTAGFAHDEWGHEGTDQIPHQYLLQVQHQLLVTDLPVAHVAVLFGVDDYKQYTVTANDDIQQKIVKRVTHFWEHHVMNRTPPDPDWKHNATLPLVKGLYTEVVRVPNLVLNLDDLVRQYRQAQEQHGAAEKERDALKAQLIDAMGNAEEAVTPRGYRLRRKAITRRSYTVEESKYIQFYVSDPKGV